MQNNSDIKSIAIFGLGLIGGTLAKSFAENGITLYGYDNNKDTLILASNDNIFEFVTDDIDMILSIDVDLIYLALPVFTTVQMLDILSAKGVHTLITDATSCKKTICDKAVSLNLNFIGGHPIAGKEVSGYINSDNKIFKGAKHILINSDDKINLNKLSNLHKMIGMNIDYMSATHHDATLANVSHLPHLIAFNLIDYVNTMSPNSFNYIGAGFKDFTRIAASDEFMWSHIFIDNKHELLKAVAGLELIISDWKKLIQSDDYDKLIDKIKHISSIRRGLK